MSWKCPACGAEDNADELLRCSCGYDPVAPFKENNMDFDKDKIDEYTLALLYLVTHDREEGFGARAWKGFDWDTLNRLHAKGYITDPIGKAKSVGMSEEGFLKARELCERHFSKKGAIIPFPEEPKE